MAQRNLFLATIGALAACSSAALAQADPQADPALAAYRAGDIDTASRLWDAQCQSGISDICGTLGELYEAGTDVSADLARARGYYEMGCRGSGLSTNALPDFNACYRGGLMFANGVGGPVDGVKARHAFAVGCAGPDNDPAALNSCNGLAQATRSGLGGPADQGLALIQFTMLCYSDHAASCMAAGDMVERAEYGPGPAPGLPEAVYAYAKACELGEQLGCAARDRLAGEAN